MGVAIGAATVEHGASCVSRLGSCSEEVCSRSQVRSKREAQGGQGGGFDALASRDIASGSFVICGTVLSEEKMQNEDGGRLFLQVDTEAAFLKFTLQMAQH